MPRTEVFILLGMGILFVILGIGAYIWGKREETRYYNAIASRPDVREYIEHSPFRPEPGALKIGGRIAIALGVLMAAAGAIVYWIQRM